MTHLRSAPRAASPRGTRRSHTSSGRSPGTGGSVEDGGRPSSRRPVGRCTSSRISAPWAGSTSASSSFERRTITARAGSARPREAVACSRPAGSRHLRGRSSSRTRPLSSTSTSSATAADDGEVVRDEQHVRVRAPRAAPGAARAPPPARTRPARTVISSHTRSSGPAARARAIATLWRSPPESSPGNRSPAGWQPDPLEQTRDLGLGVRGRDAAQEARRPRDLVARSDVSD